jgi:histidinol-phosphate aminotransferase
MERVPTDRLVLLDEAYAEFVRDEAAVDGFDLIGRYPNLVLLRTFSKAYGLAGVRVGYAIGPVPILDAARATAIPLGVTGVATAGAIAAMAPDAEAELLRRVDVLAERRDALRAALIAQGWPIPEAQGNFVWLPAGERTFDIAERLFDAGIVARAFPGDGIRISVGEAESVDVLLRVLGELVGASQEGPST